MPKKVPAKERVLRVFKEHDDAMSPLSVARKAGINKNTARRVLQELAEEGKLRKKERGLYAASGS